MRTHQHIDARSLDLHRLYARRIEETPELFDIVRRNLVFLRTKTPPGGMTYIDEWQRAADAGIEICLALAAEDSERARALRQSSPFAGVISQRERFEFFKRWKDDHDA